MFPKLPPRPHYNPHMHTHTHTHHKSLRGIPGIPSLSWSKSSYLYNKPVKLLIRSHIMIQRRHKNIWFRLNRFNKATVFKTSSTVQTLICDLRSTFPTSSEVEAADSPQQCEADLHVVSPCACQIGRLSTTH